MFAANWGVGDLEVRHVLDRGAQRLLDIFVVAAVTVREFDCHLEEKRAFAGSSQVPGHDRVASDRRVTTVVLLADTGAGTDASAFDPETKLAFASNGEGTLTVVHEDSADQFSVVANVPTKKSARTMALDLKTHNIFLPAADFDAPAQGERRGKMKPDSFVVLMVTP